MSKMLWTYDQITKLEKMWLAGDTAAKIAGELGCSRSAAIGKAHRLNLSKRENPVTETSLQAKFELMVEMVSERNMDLSTAARYAKLRLNTAMRMWAGMCEELDVPMLAGGDA